MSNGLAEYKLFHKFFEKSNDAQIVCKEKGIITHWNPAATKMFGFKKDEVIGKPMTQTIVPKMFHKKKIRGLKRFFKTGIGKVIGKTQESLGQKKDGAIFPIELSVSAIKPAFSKTYWALTSIRDLTQKKETEEKLKSIFDYSPDAITVANLKGEIIECNKATLKIHGIKDKKMLLGKNALSLVDPIDRERAIHNMMITLKKGSIQDVEYTLTRKNGERFLGQLSASLIKNSAGAPVSFVANTKDISTRKKDELKLKTLLFLEELISKISSKFIHTFNINKSINFTLRELGRFCNADRAYLFRINNKETLVSNTHGWVREGVSPQITSMQHFEIKEFTWLETTLRKNKIINIPDVSILPKIAKAERKILEMQDIKSILIFPINIKGKISGFVGLDNTCKTSDWPEENLRLLNTVAEIIGSALERYYIYKDLKLAYENLKKTQNELIQAERLSAVGMLTMGISHEFNNILASISGAAQLAHAYPNDKELVDKSCKTVVSETHRGRDIIRDLNLYLRQTPPNFKKINSYQLVEDCLALLIKELKDDKIKVTHRCKEKCTIEGDPVQLKQVVLNIVLNAIHAMLPKSKKELSISCKRTKKMVFIYFKDSGIGIKKENIGKIFDPFFTTKGPIAGGRFYSSGLGLSISKGIIENHKGTISVKSKEGQYTTFTLKLPIRQQN